MSAPIYDRLKKYNAKNRISFAMPGHKNGRGIKNDMFRLDVTELPETLDLRSDTDETVAEAQGLLSKLYGSDESYILTCGSTAGIQAMLSSALRHGETVLASADCHMSVINTCAICGFNIRFIPATIDEETLIPHDDADIEELLDKNTDVAAVIVTSPNYYGMCRDIERFAKACHDRDIPLLVDEAHGAHFVASSRLPKPAIQCGADAVVNSAHKTLNALTGAAYLHLKSSLISYRRVRNALAMLQTSSPSYPIAASADTAREELQKTSDWDRFIDMCLSFRNEIKKKTFLRLVENDDPTRLVINFSVFDTTGFEMLEVLENNYGIDIEMADKNNIVLIATPSNTREDFEALYTALSEIYDVLGVKNEKQTLLSPPSHNGTISPQLAFYSEPRMRPISESIGEISAVTVTAYPPGIPILCAGEKITPSHVVYIRHLKNIGAVFTNFDGTRLAVI